MYTYNLCIYKNTNYKFIYIYKYVNKHIYIYRACLKACNPTNPLADHHVATGPIFCWFVVYPAFEYYNVTHVIVLWRGYEISLSKSQLNFNRSREPLQTTLHFGKYVHRSPVCIHDHT